MEKPDLSILFHEREKCPRCGTGKYISIEPRVVCTKCNTPLKTLNNGEIYYWDY